jgi:hypothetical protein
MVSHPWAVALFRNWLVRTTLALSGVFIALGVGIVPSRNAYSQPVAQR